MPVAVRNNKRTLTVFSDIPTKSAVEWAPKGDPDGNDIQFVPDVLMEHPRFLRAIGIGIFSVVDKDNPELVEMIEKQAAQYARGQRVETDEIQALLERSSTGREIVISEEQMAAHIDSLSRGTGATLDENGAPNA